MLQVKKCTNGKSARICPSRFFGNGANQKSAPFGLPQNGAKISEDFRVKNDSEKKLTQSSLGQEKKFEQNENVRIDRNEAVRMEI